jgi:hypothetical protein
MPRCVADERQQLEQLCRYISRPAMAKERLMLNPVGQVVLKLKTAYRDGTTHVVMSPLEFMQRLAALVPRPRLLCGDKKLRPRQVGERQFQLPYLPLMMSETDCRFRVDFCQSSDHGAEPTDQGKANLVITSNQIEWSRAPKSAPSA